MELHQRQIAFQGKHLVQVVAVRAGRHPATQRGQRLFERGLRLASGDSDTGFHDAVRGQHDQTRIGDVGQESEREARRSVRASAHLLGIRQRGFVAMVAVGDKDRQLFERGVNRRVDRRIGDDPEPVSRVLGSGEADRRRPRRNPLEHLGDAAALAFVQEPERFQADLRRAKQGQAVFFRTLVRPLVRQHHLVGIGLQAQGGDQVPANTPIESHLMHVHRPRVRLEDPVVEPPLEIPRGTVVIRARPRQMHNVVLRHGAIVSDV